MNFDSDKMTVKSLFASKKQFEIPRFQREYSWEEQHLREFWDDIVMHVRQENMELLNSEYFWGTMLVIGSFTGTEDKLLIVDGQQRLTTMTIFFSCLSNIYLEEKQSELSKISWGYLSFNDDDNNKKFILLNETPNPFFQRKIQTMGNTDTKPNSDEEKRIEFAFDYLKTCLSERELRKKFKQNKMVVDKISYLDLLKSVRDQVLKSVIICISTLHKNEASMIFEILNAKGKSLSHIDLIKNKIFEVMKTESPTDEAKNYWKETHDILSQDGEYIDFETYFHYFWISNFKSTPINTLYDKFKKEIKSDENSYADFLKRLRDSALNYVKIIKPNREHYKNKQEYFYLVESLKNINNNFNIKISRVIMLSLLEAFNAELLSSKMLKKAIRFIEKYHFVRNTLLKQRGNLQAKYSLYANKLRKCSDRNKSSETVNELINDLTNMLPKYEEFEGAFINLSYTKKDVPSNIPAKYAIYCLHKYYDKIDYIVDNLSIEHILNESSNAVSCNIGNIIVVEKNLNECRDMEGVTPKDKVALYKKSKLAIIEDLTKTKDLSKWDEKSIRERAIEMSKTFYYKILKGE